MFYRLTCPHCRQAADHLFVRPGAVASCPACLKAWRIEPAHVTRLNPTGKAGTEPVEAAAVPSPRVAGASSGDTAMVGLSGLSEVMRRGGQATPEGDTDDTPDAAPPAAGPPHDPPHPRELREEAARQRAEEAQRRRGRRTLLTMLLGLTLMVGVLGALVAVLASRGGGGGGGPWWAETANPNVPKRPAAVLPIDDAALVRPARDDVRAMAEPGGEKLRLPIRLTATVEAAPPPFDLVVTAVRDGRLTHAWRLAEDRPLRRGEDLYLVAILEPVTQDDAATESLFGDDTRWTVTALLDPTAVGPTDEPAPGPAETAGMLDETDHTPAADHAQEAGGPLEDFPGDPD